jgi:hypothetical protein
MDAALRNEGGICKTQIGKIRSCFELFILFLT